ncbi:MULTISPECIES: TonB-dependent receptor [unclassified Novosphingobium]|uniref:TonB-dependent receptor n=1 Tax=unclassified Novosphingobium TaxID=2644732 RepID=UPI00086CB034|nr:MULTISPECIES: TonB-dependent receptor [unclassified Novosphingobium]MBN9144913.1 TonB-dependent receptor [Novosphingobium sp.]MDR6707991.1 catecholate siderophore receptor [Novosphingobium sp. 1748]ODU82472.1 MAG: TonB-dependent receptor [Novosphingobium sp. SCN 63-17]OJX92176.1 MAG: TonB-dependent receptor [Novosphingobium sp. 63-713]
MNSGSKPLLLGAASLIAPAIANPALAAEQTPQQADLGSFAVTDTAVTGGTYKTERQSSPKATADLVDTPRSITVVTRQVLEDTSSTTLAEALRTVPGITLGSGEGGNPLGDRPFLRGSDSSNAIYLDGVRDIAATSRETFAVESIEITKGSDGITNGSGNAGGSINIVSKSPEKRRFINADATYGTKDYKRFTADINQPISDFVGLRVSGMYHDQGVAGRDYVWQRRWGIAPSLKIGMTGPTSLTLDWYHMQSSELPDQGIPYTRIASSFGAGYYEVAPLGTDPFTTANGGTVQRQRGTFYGLVNRDFRTSNTDAFTARFEHKISPDLKIRNTVRYSNTEQDYLWTLPDDSRGNLYSYGTISRRVNARYSKQDGLVDQLDLSGKFNTGGIQHSFAAGLEFNWQKSAIGNYLSDTSGTAVALAIACPTATTGTNGICTSASNPNPFDAFNVPVVKGPNNSQTFSDWTTLSAYVFDTITLSDKWMINLGGRYDRYLTHVSASSAAPYTAARTWQRRVDDLFTYQAGLVYKPRPNGSFYISTSTSAIAPGSFLSQGLEDNTLTATTIGVDALKVQKSTTYEAGTKWNLFDENLSLSLAVFQTRTTNVRANLGDGTVGFIGDKRVRGIELGISGNITDKWSLFGGWAHMPSVMLNGGYTLVGTAYVPAAITGKRAPNTPLDSISLTTTYKVTPKFTLGGGAIYMGKVYGGYSFGSTASTVRAVYTPSYWRFDANAAYQLTDHIGVKVSALNLTNKLYYDATYVSHYAHQAAGRTILASLSLKY